MKYSGGCLDCWGEGGQKLGCTDSLIFCSDNNVGILSTPRLSYANLEANPSKNEDKLLQEKGNSNHQYVQFNLAMD